MPKGASALLKPGTAQAPHMCRGTTGIFLPEERSEQARKFRGATFCSSRRGRYNERCRRLVFSDAAMRRRTTGVLEIIRSSFGAAITFRGSRCHKAKNAGIRSVNRNRVKFYPRNLLTGKWAGR